MGENKMKRKGILAFAAVLALLTALMCVTAFAEGNVAKIGDTEYATLDEAITAVGTEAVTINVLQNTTVSGQTISNKNITFDGTGSDGENFTITVKTKGDTPNVESNSLLFGKGAQVTFRNINITRTEESGHGVIKITSSTGNVILESGAVIKDVLKSTRAAAVQIEGGGSVTMKEGSRIENCTGIHSAVRCVLGSFIMNGGEITGCQAPNAGMASAIYVSNADAVVTINGGSIKGNGSSVAGFGAIFVKNGTLNVAKEAVIKGNGHANIYVDGGTLNAPDGITDNLM